MKKLVLSFSLSLLLLSCQVVGAAAVTQPVYYARLHLHLLLPTNVDGVNPSDVTPSCVSFLGSDANQLVQVCRLADKHITDFVAAWQSNKGDLLNNGGFPEYAPETSRYFYDEVNGMQGEFGAFFYQTPGGTVFANDLYVAQTDSDVIIYLYQVPVTYKPGAIEGTDILASLDVFSP